MEHSASQEADYSQTIKKILTFFLELEDILLCSQNVATGLILSRLNPVHDLSFKYTF